MYSLISQSGHISYGIKEYVCDTIKDIDSLPIDGKAGSTVYIIEDSSTYILSHKGEWKKKKNFNNGGSNEELEAQIEALTAENAALTAANADLITKNNTLENEVSQLTTENTDLSNQVNDLQTQTHTLTNSVNALTTENNTLKSDLEKALSEIEILKAELKDLTEFVPSEDEKTLSVPTTETMIKDTTIIVSEESSEIEGTTLILK